MSRFRNNPLLLKEGVEIVIKDKEVITKGKKGEIKFILPEKVVVKQKDNSLLIDIEEGGSLSFIGLTYRVLSNNIIGVTKGFEKKLEVNGVGYRWSVSGKKLTMQLGFSHDIIFDIPESITIEAKGNSLTIMGIDKMLIGEVGAKIKKYRPVEPYKGKGIRYTGEYVIRKQGKSGA